MRNTTRASNRPGRTVAASALATALGLSLLGMAPASFAQPAATHQFAVASQPLGEALNRLAETAGVQIMVPPDLVRGHTAPAPGPTHIDRRRRLLPASTRRRGAAHRRRS